MATDDDKKKDSTLTRIDDNTVTLIAYTIVSVKRGDEKIMDGGEGSVIVTEKMSDADFASWILAKYMQEEVDPPASPMEKKKEKVDAPGHPAKKTRRAELIKREELQYLRVYYVVSNRWPREPLEFEQKEVTALQEIRDAIGKL